jgi:putative flippase GtrA
MMALGLLMNVVCLILITNSHWLAQLIAMAVGVLVSFFTHRYFVFVADSKNRTYAK